MKIGFLLGLIIALTIGISFINNVNASTEISSCSNLNIEYETYLLTSDIIDNTDYRCMYVTNNSITLDCQNHLIDSQVSINERHGIEIHWNGLTNITIKNCIVSDYSGNSGYYSACIMNFGNNFIENSTLKNCDRAIAIQGESVILNNSIIENSYYAIWSMYFSNSKFYNNIFNGSSYYYTGNTHKWNTTKQLGNRIIFSNLFDYISGNYYTNPSKTGYSDNCMDLDKDGFCDNPYSIDNNNIDYMPLASNKIYLNLTIDNIENNKTGICSIINNGYTIKAFNEINDTGQLLYRNNTLLSGLTDTQNIVGYWNYTTILTNSNYSANPKTVFLNVTQNEIEITTTYNYCDNSNYVTNISLTDKNCLFSTVNLTYNYCEYGCDKTLNRCMPNDFYMLGFVSIGLFALFVAITWIKRNWF